MTYQELAYRFLATVAGTTDRLTRADLEEIDLASLEEVGSAVLLETARLAAQGLPPFSAPQYTRAVVLRDWGTYRDGPAACFVDLQHGAER